MPILMVQVRYLLLLKKIFILYLKTIEKKLFQQCKQRALRQDLD